MFLSSALIIDYMSQLHSIDCLLTILPLLTAMTELFLPLVSIELSVLPIC